MYINTLNTIVHFRLVPALVLALVSVLAGPAAAADTCGCDIPSGRVAAYDALLPAMDSGVSDRHIPYGPPRSLRAVDDAFRADQSDFAVLYDPGLGMPVWVSYTLTASAASARRPRTQCFRPDPRFRAVGIPGCADYRRSGFDRGHMTPSADMAVSEAAMVNSYLFTNIAPQYPGFNRTIWAALERIVRVRAMRSGAVHVTTGAIFDRDGDGRPDPDEAALTAGPPGAEPRLRVATHFFKIVAWRAADGGVAVDAWLLAHRPDFVPDAARARALDAARVGIERVEAMAGFDFLPALNAPPEQAAAPTTR